MGLPPGWTRSLVLCCGYALVCVSAFNVESEAWKRMEMSAAGQSFGYRVIQDDSSSLLVSAPLEQYEVNRRGRIYRCQIGDTSCRPLSISVPRDATNMSLGLSMSKSDIGSDTLACGPTITKECDSINMYGGMCLGVSNPRTSTPVPSALEECQVTDTDIAFLLDGSGSVSPYDFTTMKNFVVNLIQTLKAKTNTIQFAVAQYSSGCDIHLNFNEFSRAWNWASNVKNIRQQQGGTNTAAAISKLVRDLFESRAGARPNANKILIVITDGESQDGGNLPSAIARADAKKIIRYAIGVGRAFDSYQAKQELNTIASSPANNYVFKVSNFGALSKILSTLEENIIAIEGSKTQGDATRLEFSQSGFSAVSVTMPSSVSYLGVVGAYDWAGGLQPFAGSLNNQFIRGTASDSYLGYSMDVAFRDNRNYVIVGAPRYQHKGQVMVINGDIKQKLEQSPGQIGSYFGAEVCAVDLDGDKVSDLILVAAPMYTDDEHEGRVFVYQFKSETFYSVVQDTRVVLLGAEDQWGRFGSALASLADLNGDGIRDVAVGAPLEDGGQGSIYIFNGKRGGITPQYSQRVPGSSVGSGLQFFGLTVASSALDQSGDKLPDIAVGSKGHVLVLRSRPIVSIDTRITFDPLKIPTSISDCSTPQPVRARLCFTMNKKTTYDSSLRALLRYNLTLDAEREKSRAFFPGGAQKSPITSGELTLQQREKCYYAETFNVECSPEDILSPLIIKLAFSFEGLRDPQAANLKPILSPISHTTATSRLEFEIDCGQDKVCVDNLKIDFSFSGSTAIEVGIAQDVNITITVENTGENSYNTYITLKYPQQLSYRSFKKNKGRVECRSVDSEDSSREGVTTCDISRPVFKPGDKAVFVVQYGVDTNEELGEAVNFTAQAFSGNGEHGDDRAAVTKSIGVKYSIYVNMKRFEDSTGYINFTAGEKEATKPVQQYIQVLNTWRNVPLVVSVKVPIRLENVDIWTDADNMKIVGCGSHQDVKPAEGGAIGRLKKTLELDCAVATCRVFTCHLTMRENTHAFLNITGNVSSAWIEQTELRSAEIDLISQASMEFDEDKYIYYSTTRQKPPVYKVKTEVEVYEIPNFTKEIIGGTVGGLLLLALITAGLVKAGFFKSQYKTMMEEAGGGEGGEGGGAEGGGDE